MVKFFWVGILFFGISSCASSIDTTRKTDQTRDELTPDIKQFSSELPGGGEIYCGPVATANVLIWLSRRGYERLASQPCSDSICQYDLVKLLGDTEYFNIDAEDGTNEVNIKRGLSAYFSKQSYRIDILDYKGWGKSKVEPVSIEWINQAFQNEAGVLLRIGWYKFIRESKSYRRIGGHWVTLVGIEGNSWYLHDPRLPGSGSKKISLSLLSAGQLMRKNGAAVPATGFFRLGGSYRKMGADEVILEGVLAFKPSEGG